MNQIGDKKYETFNKFLISLDEDLGRDQDSIYLFEWVIEDRYGASLSDNIDYYSDRPDLMGIHNEVVLFELDKMLTHFTSIEEYEKCASIVKIKEEFVSIIKNIK
mgnify:FL=1|jgi:hypothetical protein